METFDLELPPEEAFLTILQNSTMEALVGQLQSYTDKLLCVIDGTTLHYYQTPGQLPKKIRFEHKQLRNGIMEYYFRDIRNDNLYCVFGREAAKIFFPEIDQKDPGGISEWNSTASDIPPFENGRERNITRSTGEETSSSTDGTSLNSSGSLKPTMIIDGKHVHEFPLPIASPDLHVTMHSL